MNNMDLCCACVYIRYLRCYVTEVSLQCLASWKDGSQLYLYGGFSGPGIVTKEDTYRCFVSINSGCHGIQGGHIPLFCEYKVRTAELQRGYIILLSKNTLRPSVVVKDDLFHCFVSINRDPPFSQWIYITHPY